jgi:hypothetical protein
VADQCVEQRIDTGLGPSDASTDGVPSRVTRPSRASEGQHLPRGVACTEEVESVTGCLRVAHDHRTKRLADGRLERLLPAGINRHEIEHRAQHAVDVCERSRACCGAGIVQRKRQSFSPSRPTMVVGLGVSLCGLRGRQLVLSGKPGQIGRFVS